MPIYEYRCRRCGQFEMMQRITDDALTRCPTCRSKVTKLISNTSFQLKGSGWYATDYAGKSTKGKESGSGDVKSTAGDAGGESATTASGKADGKAKKAKDAVAA